MKLEAYLEKHKMSPFDFAALIKCSVDTVFRWKRGITPSKVYQRLIEEKTKGQIKEKDWI